jgi:hypothetical protein
MSLGYVILDAYGYVFMRRTSISNHFLTQLIASRKAETRKHQDSNEDVRDFPELLECCKKSTDDVWQWIICKAGFSVVAIIESIMRKSVTDEDLKELLKTAITQ